MEAGVDSREGRDRGTGRIPTRTQQAGSSKTKAALVGSLVSSDEHRREGGALPRQLRSASEHLIGPPGTCCSMPMSTQNVVRRGHTSCTSAAKIQEPGIITRTSPPPPPPPMPSRYIPGQVLQPS